MMNPRPSSPSTKRNARPLRRSSQPLPRPRIATVIFDLDDTLYDCFGQRVLAAHRRAAQAMAAAGLPATAEEIFECRMQAFRTDPQLTYIDAEVCRRFAVAEPDAIVRAARHAFFTLAVGKLKLFPGALKLLRTLKRRGVKIFVVSFGDPHIQRDKAAALGLDREPAIDRMFCADAANVFTKEGIFRTILKHAEPDPRRVLVVGDRPSSEIRAGKSLGMHTVRLRRGEFAALDPRGSEEQADHEIKKITDLLHLPYTFGSQSRL